MSDAYPDQEPFIQLFNAAPVRLSSLPAQHPIALAIQQLAGGGTATAGDPPILNWFWNAVDTAMAGGKPAILVGMGDSNTVGQGAGDSGAALLTNARPY